MAVQIFQNHDDFEIFAQAFLQMKLKKSLNSNFMTAVHNIFEFYFILLRY